MSHAPPIAIVGASWRHAPTSLRARLQALDATDASPLESLRKSGYVSGTACITTCSRTEWVLAADDPKWAANLLQGSLLALVPELTPTNVHLLTGREAIDYVFHVALGLDSVAEGETAVGRQVLRAFEKAHAEGTSDRRLRVVWKHLERVLGDRREQARGFSGRGVQALVVKALEAHDPKRGPVEVLGRGEIGQAVARVVKAAGFASVTVSSRKDLPELLHRLDKAPMLVVCTGGPSPWLELPRSKRNGLVIDIGSPPQLVDMPGWTVLGLDDILSQPGARLPREEHDKLVALATEAAKAAATRLSRPPPSATLAAIEELRTRFLHEALPGLLDGLPDGKARQLKHAVGSFTHALIVRAREMNS